METSALLTAISIGVALLIATPLLGGYMAAVFSGQRTVLSPIFSPIERLSLRSIGEGSRTEQTWREYAVAFLAFTILSIALLFALQLAQGALPLNPQGFGPVEPLLALNTAVSFATTTNWQNYAGEATMSHLTQTLGLAAQQFLAAAAGIAVAVAVIRGFVQQRSSTIGNFWVDLVRATIYILVPLAVAVALIDVWQGVPQTMSAPAQAQTLQGPVQSIALGLIASMDPIKILGSNGGGYLNANGAHPLINPTPITNWVGMFSNLLIPFAFTATFGRMAGNARQGWVLFAAMAVILVSLSMGSMAVEHAGNPLFPSSVDQTLGSMEGKEVRFGADVGALSATTMASTTTGAPAATYGSLQPLSGGIAIFLMSMGPLSPGGDGSGLLALLTFVLVSLFLAGLMVGRLPEYLGKKIEGHEVKIVTLLMIAPMAIILGATAISVVTPAGLKGPLAGPPHGFTEVLYAFTSMTSNNGSAFASLSGNSPYYNLLGAAVMLAGRVIPVVLMLALAGSLAAKRRLAPTQGTFPTTGVLFVALLVGVVVIETALSFFGGLALGPGAENLLQHAGVSL